MIVSSSGNLVTRGAGNGQELLLRKLFNQRELCPCGFFYKHPNYFMQNCDIGSFCSFFGLNRIVHQYASYSQRIVGFLIVVCAIN